MSRRPSRHLDDDDHEQHSSSERWLVTYADMVTLLMVLFIVMFAVSQVDEKKFAELRDGLAAGFGSPSSVLDGAKSLQDQPGTTAVADVSPQLLAQLSPEQRTAVEQAVQQTEQAQQERTRAAASAEAQRLEKLRKKLLAALRAAGLQHDVRASYDPRGLVLSLVSHHVVFDADLATLSPRGQAVVDRLGTVLAAIPDALEIDGHTNQAPGRPKYFPTDWDLSAARAITVLRRLQDASGIASNRLSLAAFGHTRPLVPPDRPGSQAINKRVDIVVLSAKADGASALGTSSGRADLSPTPSSGPGGSPDSGRSLTSAPSLPVGAPR